MISTKDQQIANLKVENATIIRDRDQKLLQARMKYEEHLLAITTKLNKN